MSEVDPGPDHDPRLEASGDEHPGIERGAIDLVALENTRQGFRLAGIALFGIALGHFAAALGAGSSFGSVVHFAFHGLFIAGLLVMAPTPNGPLPRVAQAIFAAALAVMAAAPLISWGLVRWAVLPASVLGSLLWYAWPFVLWRFCQHRGLTGRALVWLWLGMFGLGSFLFVFFPWLFGVAGGVLAAAAGAASFHTARDLWLDALGEVARRHRPASAAGGADAPVPEPGT